MTPRHELALRRESTGLLVVDVQEAFRPVIDGFDQMVHATTQLVRGFGVLGRPVVVSEQYPKGLGATVPELAEHLPAGTVVAPKLRFSAVGVGQIDDAIATSGCRSWVLAGIETHVCVAQTALDLLAAGHRVQVAADAVSSRSPVNRSVALERLRDAGAQITCAEMALFEMLVEAGTEEFTAISKVVR